MVKKNKTPVKKKNPGRLEPDPKTLKYSKEDLAARDAAHKQRIGNTLDEGMGLRQAQARSIETTPKVQPDHVLNPENYIFSKVTLKTFSVSDCGTHNAAFASAVSFRNAPENRAKERFGGKITIEALESSAKPVSGNKEVTAYDVVLETTVRKPKQP